MLSTVVIEKSLLRNYTAAIRERGYSYYEQAHVGALKVDSDLGVIRTKVSNTSGYSYRVILELDTDRELVIGSCDCPYDRPCKHEVAALHELKDWITVHPDTLAKKEEEKQAEAVAKAEAEEFPRYLALAETSAYRELFMPGDDIDRALEKYSPRDYRLLSWNESYEGKFISTAEIELRSTSEYNVYNFKEQKIAVKYEDGKLFVKCLSCSVRSQTLCAHQTALLLSTKEILKRTGFFQGSLEYDKIVQQGIDQTGVDRAAFDTYYAIALKPNGFLIEAIEPSIVSARWLKTAREVLEQQKKKQEKSTVSRIQALQQGRQQKFAFLWAANFSNNQHQSESNVLYFVRGNGFKTKPGIHATNRKISQVPDGLPTDFKELGQALFFALREQDPLRRFEQVMALFESHFEVFSRHYQYIYTSHNNPGHDSMKAADLLLVEFHPTPLQCTFKVYRKDGLVQIERHLTLDDDPFDYAEIVYSNEFFCATYDRAYLYPNYPFNHFTSLFDEHEKLIIPFTDKKEYTQLIRGLQQYFEVEVAEGLTLQEETLLRPSFQILLREVGDFVLFEPRLQYQDYSFNAFDADSYHVEEKVFRAEESDRQFLIDFLTNAHPEFNRGIQVQEYVYLDFRSMINNYWFIHFSEACEAAGIVVLGQEELTKFRYSKHRASTFSHVRSGIDWFEVEMSLSFGDEKIKTADWIRALRNKESFVKLKDGTLGMLPEEWLKQAQKILAVADVDKNGLQISKYRFNIIEDLFEEIDDLEIIKELKAKKARLAQLEFDKKYPIPLSIKAELREYQKHGFAWLKFLDESGFGGILADDMGLGKTVQVICLLADQIEEAPSLVVVPRSLLFNWAAELDKFCPDLKYVIHHGPTRTKDLEELWPCHLIITTYGTAAADVEMFKDFAFNYIVLDESQAIKNPDSKRYKAMRLLKAKNRLAMTGTPIENNTFDLFAQLSFTSPGLLGTKTSFKNNFAIPIDNQGDADAATLLRKLIHPFLLRRTKEQVAQDLPEKTESIIFCEMGNTQRKLYDNLKRKIKEDIETAVEENGLAKSKFKMLDGLLRLRQMCNSPLLLNPSFSGANAESVKIDLLLQHIYEELGQHNALVFSQFVSLLTIVRRELDDRGIKYAYLDGSTNKRQQEVERFMNDDSIKIFLISLKAGNTGMNLTKADYVYILDPWWNPAVEAQAIDRTHRIGQDKQIFAYKLICKDSIEEKILKLQEKKKHLAKDLIRTDENVLKSLDKTELMALFD